MKEDVPVSAPNTEHRSIETEVKDGQECLKTSARTVENREKLFMVFDGNVCKVRTLFRKQSMMRLHVLEGP